MNKICVNFTKNLLKFCTFFQEILEIFDNLVKFRQLSKTISTNFDKFIQFMKILSEESF